MQPVSLLPRGLFKQHTLFQMAFVRDESSGVRIVSDHYDRFLQFFIESSQDV